MRRSTALAAIMLAVSLGGFVGGAAAQGVQYGIIRGTVTDQQGLPIPNVTVTATSPSMQGPRTTTTGPDGTYSLLQLPSGTYALTFETTAFSPAKRSTAILLGLTVEQNVQLQTAGVTEQIQVTAAAPAPIATATVGANYKHDEIDALPTQRTLVGIAQLAPGLTQNTPNNTQVTINGAYSFDNVFMLNGVDVNDNLFGYPQNLFIEDAIEETQIITSGITAEYGRFTGGVINAVTKSGGNTFSGSFRTGLSNPSWTKPTPFETCDPAVTTASCRKAAARPDTLQPTYEATLGGPIVKDRLWFFGATRYSKFSTAGSLPISNLANTQTDTNKRGEIKLTSTLMQNHTVQGGYLNNARTQASRPSFGFTIDKNAVGDRTTPNWYTFANYRGVLRSNLLAEAQYSRRKFGFRGSGGTSTNIIDSPMIDLNQGNFHYNAQYFDATDPQNRNNGQLTGNVTYFVQGVGRHEFKSGYEFFRSQLIGGNSQSATGYVFDADWAEDVSGAPLLDSNGRLIPVFVPGDTLIENWLPSRGATLNVDTQSVFLQDHWVINSHWSADLGFRYERVKSEATGGFIGVDTSGFVPRLAIAFDPGANGRNVIHATYGHYSGRYNEAQIGGNNNVGNPDLLLGVYTGPPGQGRSFAPGFTPANYETVLGQFPTANIFLEKGLTSPIVKEFTLSYGADVMNGRGYAEASFIARKTSHIIDDTVTLANGVTHVVQHGLDIGTFTNVVYRNLDIARREYQGLLFQGRYNIRPRWTLNGHYTLQIKNDGNNEGEAANQPGVTSGMGDYPEIFNGIRTFPDGRLSVFQRHKLAVWSIYNLGLGKIGDATLSGLWRVNSGTSYSLKATNQALTEIQKALISAYPDEPSPQEVFFGERGSQMFKGYGVIDVGLGYNVPVFKTLRPYVKFDIYNVLNNQKQIRWNTTVTQDPNSPKDALGLATGYREGASFGKATSNQHFPIPYGGDGNAPFTGGRTYQMAVGFRF
jgi:Carboxypeptidase regulatory-like domain/TonB dependent receptor-like, beta-barrel